MKTLDILSFCFVHFPSFQILSLHLHVLLLMNCYVEKNELFSVTNATNKVYKTSFANNKNR